MFLTGLRTRTRVPELMDDPALDPAEHRRALAALARINRVSNSAGVLWPEIRKVARARNGGLVSVLDVATGSGDVPAALEAKARRAGEKISITACDISSVAIKEARNTHQGISFFEWDAVRNRLPDSFDIVTCSLFLHHLTEDDAVALLANMKEVARYAVLVNDLARSRINYCATWFACHVLTGSRVVRFDGPASVRSSFTPKEALALADRAGLHGAKVQWKFPCRFLLSWRRA